MRIEDVMIRDIAMVAPSETVAHAARLMADLDAGALPVGPEDGTVQGIITDRDIVLRVVATGRHPEDTAVSEAMSGEVSVCRPDDAVEQIAQSMGLRQIRRMPVVENGKMVGIVTLADLERLMAEGPLGC